MKMTQRYAHFSPEHLQSAIGFMDMGVTPEGENFNSCPFPNQREKTEFPDNVVLMA